MSEFDKLKNDAEQYAKDHPEQVQKAEQAAENKLGLPGQGGDQPGQDAQGQDAQGQAQQNQGGADQGGQGSSGQDPSGQGQ
ncbi:MAG: hypothetical protein QOG05_4152 [Streptosporangiaceae bacterium]|nr:hypothetical protein [Streptosporangiaceae bacterium]